MAGEWRACRAKFSHSLPVREALIGKGRCPPAHKVPKDSRTIRAGGKLGACLAAQKRYADAEPLVIGYFDAIRGAKNVPPPEVRAAGEQVVALYHAWGKPEKAAEWREKLK